MHQLLKRLEPQAGGFILRITAQEAQAMGLSAGDELQVQLALTGERRREDLMRR